MFIQDDVTGLDLIINSITVHYYTSGVFFPYLTALCRLNLEPQRFHREMQNHRVPGGVPAQQLHVLKCVKVLSSLGSTMHTLNT